MIHQRRFAGLNIIVAHDALASRTGSAVSTAAGCVSGVAGADSLGGVITKGSDAGASLEGLADASDDAAASVDAAAFSSIPSAELACFSSEVMTLAVVKPLAASRTSSKLFLRSAISASRIAS